MALSVNTKAYTANQFAPNAIFYVGPAKSLTVKDDIRAGIVAPKPTSTFSGVSRQSFKLTRTHTLTGALSTVGDSISECNFSIPVGTSTGDIDTICADLGAWIASAAFKTLLKTATINA